MAQLRMTQIQSPQMQQGLRQVLRIEQANLLEMSEADFHSLIAETEQNSLFQQLFRREKLIRYQRFPRTDVSNSLYKIDELKLADNGSADVESLLTNKEDIVQQIQKIGLAKFKRLFVFPEDGLTLEEIAVECGLDVPTVRKINSLLDDFSVMSEFYHPSHISPGRIHYSKIAAINLDEKSFITSYFSPVIARGRYAIDYERFESLVTSAAYSEKDIKQARQLFRKLELINSRKDTLNRILQNIIEKQTTFLESGDLKTLLAYTQKELAEKLGIAPSSVSRAIFGKSIDTPWGQEIPLKKMFAKPAQFKKELLRALIEKDKKPSSDEAIRCRLREKFGIAISRRSVTELRHQLNLPATRGRKRFVSKGKIE
jgi:DNA-directed RNA polymerase specialized sigma54-like protein